jgi:hypothetical protein
VPEALPALIRARVGDIVDRVNLYLPYHSDVTPRVLAALAE